MTNTTCTGHRYFVNPYAHQEGTDIAHDRPCPIHPDAPMNGSEFYAEHGEVCEYGRGNHVIGPFPTEAAAQQCAATEFADPQNWVVVERRR